MVTADCALFLHIYFLACTLEADACMILHSVNSGTWCIINEKQVCVHMLMGSAPQFVPQGKYTLYARYMTEFDLIITSQESEAAAILTEFQRFFKAPHIRKVRCKSDLKF